MKPLGIFLFIIGLAGIAYGLFGLSEVGSQVLIFVISAWVIFISLSIGGQAGLFGKFLILCAFTLAVIAFFTDYIADYQLYAIGLSIILLVIGFWRWMKNKKFEKSTGLGY